MQTDILIYQQLADQSARHFNLSARDVLELDGKNRYDETVKARHAVWVYLRKILGWQFSRIGRAAKKDHGSIIHGVKSYLVRVEMKEAEHPTLFLELRKETPVVNFNDPTSCMVNIPLQPWQTAAQLS